MFIPSSRYWLVCWRLPFTETVLLLIWFAMALLPTKPLGLVLMAPGWIRTQLGGPTAPFGVEESVPLIVDALLDRQGKPGLAFVDRDGNTVPW